MARTRSTSSAGTFPGKTKIWLGSGYPIPIPDTSTPLSVQMDAVSGVSDSSVCVDTIMPPPYVVDHDLLITHKRTRPTRLYGRANANATINTHREWFGKIAAFGSTGDCPSVTLPSDSVLKTRALANMNPSVPVVDMTAFIAQFTEIPRLVRNIGRFVVSKESRRNRSRRVAEFSELPEAWLSWSFGWAPLISDALSLFDMPRKIEERKNYLRKLEQGAHLQRSLLNTRERVLTATTKQLNGKISGSFAYFGYYETEYTTKSWYTANAKLQNSLPADPIALSQLASRLTYSLNFSPSTAWELLPWSWLIDYFANVGSLLDAQRNDVPFTVTRMNVMTHSRARISLTNVDGENRTARLSQGGFAETEVLRRTAYTNPTPSLGFLPLLSDGHIANISALAVSQARGKLGTKVLRVR